METENDPVPPKLKGEQKSKMEDNPVSPKFKGKTWHACKIKNRNLNFPLHSSLFIGCDQKIIGVTDKWNWNEICFILSTKLIIINKIPKEIENQGVTSNKSNLTNNFNQEIKAKNLTGLHNLTTTEQDRKENKFNS